MYRYIGSFEHLKELGFVTNLYKAYWFLPTLFKGKYYNPILVDANTRKVEYTAEEDLELIKDFIEKI